MWGVLLLLVAVSAAGHANVGAARLVCYSEAPAALNECTHLVYAGDARGDKLDALLKEYRRLNPRVKILLRVEEVDKDLRTLLKSKHVQGLELHNAHRTLNRTKVLETVEAARSTVSSTGGGPLFLSLPAHAELLAKYYDLRVLIKKVDLMVVETHHLGAVKKMTYHPSRLSGLWDMMNTDSVVDLVVGLGVPASKLVISLPATAQQFTLANETLSTPGSPTEEDQPKEIGQDELCRRLRKGRWTLERDQDLSAPYAFKSKTWISFEDASSVDVKGKYARVRGLAGLALYNTEKDLETPCGGTLRAALSKVLNQQSRAPRAAVLRSLEHDILAAPVHARALDALQVSPYRITQVVDSDGLIHSIREDTRTEFSCSRQGYFVHPRSCARFYRCVKFDQLSPDYTVFEFDCPAGLSFDARHEVCVWPGSIEHSQACPGSAEIAPVPQTRFICPDKEGYYADPENCRWFFACLDHGKAPLSAYEFRCPFGLGFDETRLKCEWPWLVPACGNIANYEAQLHAFGKATLTGAAGYQGQTADAVNIAAHQSLVSGATLNNLVGIQTNVLSKEALDANHLSSQGFISNNHNFESHGSRLSQGSDGLAYEGAASQIDLGLGRTNDGTKYTSGSLILDDYRLPSKVDHGVKPYNAQVFAQGESDQNYVNQNAGSSTSSHLGQQSLRYQSTDYDADNSGAYVHDPTGDYALPYRHEDVGAVPYTHKTSDYKASSDYYDYGRYKGDSQEDNKYTNDNNGQYVHDNSGAYKHEDVAAVPFTHESPDYKASSDYYEHGRYKGDSQDGNKYTNDNNGQYVHDNSGAYVESSSGYTATSNAYRTDYSGAYNSGSYNHDNSGQYEAGVYRADGHIGETSKTSSANIQSYSQANSGNYITDSKAYTGSAHLLTAGAINVGLVGKTTLVDAAYGNQDQRGYTQSISHQTLHPAHVSLISQPAVSINHVGTDENNLDGYGYVTTPTSSGVPTTATPYAVTTSLPAVTTYKTTFVPEAPKSSIKQVFGFAHPAVTYVQPTVVAVKKQHVTPQVELSNQGVNYAFETNDYSGHKSASQSQQTSNLNAQSSAASETTGYDYSKPSIQFEDGVSYTTAAPAATVSTYKPQVNSVGYQYSTPVPVTEEPFRKAFAYTIGSPVTHFVQPAVSFTPEAYSHQTIHKVEANNVNLGITGYSNGENYDTQKTFVQYTTAQPTIAVQPVVSTYQPQVYSQQTLHKVDASNVNTYSQDTSDGYSYVKPAVKFEEGLKNTVTFSTAAPTVIQYSTPAPAVVSTYKPQIYSHQTLHKFDSKPFVTVSSTPLPAVRYEYQPTPVTVYQNPILKYIEPKMTPVTYVQQQPIYKPQSYSQQTFHKVENSNDYATGNIGYENIKTVTYQQPQTIFQHTTHQPAIAVQPVVSTYKPQVYSQQTLHKVDASQVNTYSENSGYEYNKPAIEYNENEKITHSTPAPAVVSTYKPQAYSSQTIRKLKPQIFLPVSSTTVAPQLPVSVYENPILKYTQKVTPASYIEPTVSVVTQTYQPIVKQKQVSHVKFGQYEGSSQQSYEQNLQLNQEGYSYNQPEIQRNIETGRKAYSDSSLVSHQSFHLSHGNTKSDASKSATFISTTPAPWAYEEHYSEYEAPKSETYEYKAPEYIPPRNEYQQTYTVSSTAAPVVQESFVKTQDQYDINPVEYSQQYETVQKTVPIQQVSFSTSHVSEPKRIESYHISSLPATRITSNYQQGSYESPEIQVGYKTEEYLPPVVSTVTPIVTSTYRPRTYSTTTKEYLPPTAATSTTREYLAPVEPKYKAPEYSAPAVDNTYLRPSTTIRYRVKSTTPITYTESTTAYKASEYLPPGSNVVNFESFGFNNYESTAAPKIRYNPYQESAIQEEVTAKSIYRKPNIVVETAKSNLLGFGTVGPDAGLVSPLSTVTPVTYTTSAPVVTSTYRPIIKSTTQAPVYKYIQSTTYKAPEYLPPSDEGKQNTQVNVAKIEKASKYRYQGTSTSTPIYRKQNIVVQTAKANQGFGVTSGDVGAITPVAYTVSTPVAVSSTESYSVAPQTFSSTHAPEEQGLFEVTQPVGLQASRRRVKPKVAVVTKINDFNPLLVRKLGAVCSCQSPVLVLKGRRPNVPEIKDISDDYSNDYDESNRGDINEDEWAQKSARIQTPTVTVAPIITSTVNPIIVPDDSYYQDYQEPRFFESAVTPKNDEVIISSTPAVTSTQKVVRIRPRVKAVTVAPTYQTVLLNQEVTPRSNEEASSAIESQSFDRYGPGGWRSREETLQGSVDCKRAGLFRHPKQCNKFYACRWDCTKQRFTLHVFNCPVQLSFDPSIGACNWPSQGPACQGDTLLTNAL